MEETGLPGVSEWVSGGLTPEETPDLRQSTDITIKYGGSWWNTRNEENLPWRGPWRQGYMATVSRNVKQGFWFLIFLFHSPGIYASIHSISGVWL